jgi:hypothetical protein
MPNGGTAGNSAGHADSREMTFDANGNLIEVNDGGVVRRTNPGNNTGDWFAINGNIQVTEIHSVAYDHNFNIIIGGTQDTGTPEQSAPGSTTWVSVSTADGGKVAVNDSVAGTSVRYSSFQNLGGFRRRTCNPGCVTVFPALTGRGPAQFYTPLEINANDPTRLLLGTVGGLSESLDQGNTASIVPGAAVTANSDAHMVYGHPNNAELIYVGAGTQVFVRTAAGGNLAPTAGAFPGGMVFGVAVDPADENIVYAIGNASVFQSVNGGASWTDITGNLTSVNLRAVEFIPAAGGALVVGGQSGVFVMLTVNPGVWSKLGTGLPNAPVWDLEYDVTDDVLVAGTLGRGAWLVPDVSQALVLPVALDIRPQSCPNPLNCRAQGVLPAAILGTAAFDVTIVDLTSVRLEGVPPLRSALEDVATPFVPFIGKEDCDLDCTDQGPDGFLDLTLHFDIQTVLEALGPVRDRACLVLELTGQVKQEFGGAPIVGEDVVRILCR